jgi:pyrroline-5-carboxylate reductase
MTEQPAPTLDHVRVAVLGAGNMGGPIVTAIRGAGVPRERVSVTASTEQSSRAAAERLDATPVADAAEAVRDADVVVLAVKPYQFGDVLPGIGDAVRQDALVLSVAAGVTVAQIEERLPAGLPVVRAMPSTPIEIGQGAISLSRGTHATADHVARLTALLSGAGYVFEVAEDKIDQVIAVSGSAPAFVFYVIEAMIDTAVAQGLPRPLARDLAIQAVKGSAMLLEQTGRSATAAREAVMSPGGTTAAGVLALDRAGVRPGITAAMDAAAEKSRAMRG